MASSRENEKLGLTLLSETFHPIEGTVNDGTIALARVIQATHLGKMSVCGQLPDANYTLGEYFIHGGRIRFDLSELSPEDQKEFFKYISENAYSRTGTHGVGGVDASGVATEIKQGLFASLRDLLPPQRGKHKGIDLAIGGEGSSFEKDGKTYTVKANGNHGHLYLYNGNHIILAGVENARPPNPLFPFKSPKNERTGKSHGIKGGSSDVSPFGEYKAGSNELYSKMSTADACPLYPDITEAGKKTSIYNAVSVKITSTTLEQIRTNQIDANTFKDDGKRSAFINKLTQIPNNAIEVGAENSEARKQAMQAWYKQTKENVKPIEKKAKANQYKWGALYLMSMVVIAASIVAVIAAPFAIGLGLLAAASGLAGIGLAESNARKAEIKIAKQTVSVRKQLLQRMSSAGVIAALGGPDDKPHDDQPRDDQPRDDQKANVRPPNRQSSISAAPSEDNRRRSTKW